MSEVKKQNQNAVRRRVLDDGKKISFKEPMRETHTMPKSRKQRVS